MTQSKIIETAKTIEGHLSQTEMEFLYLCASVPSTKGDVVEIGSYKGKSTYILAAASEVAGDARIIAIDPLTHDSLDPHVLGKNADEEEFQHDFFHNIKQNQIENRVEFHQMYSQEFAKSYDGHIRFLWIDGDHSYQGAMADVINFSPFLADGAIVAMHDVLHNIDGPIRCFVETMVLSPHFGPVGLCGSIGWAQYHNEPVCNEKYAKEKEILYKKLSKLISYAAFHPNPKGWNKAQYKLTRSSVPHGKMTAAEWSSILISSRK